MRSSAHSSLQERDVVGRRALATPEDGHDDPEPHHDLGGSHHEHEEHGNLATDFEPAKYRDEYRERVLQLIEAKADGQVIAAAPVTEPATPVVDLMAALEASLAAAKSKAGDGKSKEAERESA